VEAFYRPMYAGFAIHPQHAAAYRTVLRECRDRGVRVVLLRMPETDRFRQFQTADSERLGDTFLNDVVTEFGVPTIDARTWAEDAHLPDGFHLTQAGAEAFTRRLLPEVRRWAAED
jgi:lysophospholipase L1-like esterase